jgi:hypothetical protein
MTCGELSLFGDYQASLEQAHTTRNVGDIVVLNVMRVGDARILFAENAAFYQGRPL